MELQKGPEQKKILVQQVHEQFKQIQKKISQYQYIDNNQITSIDIECLSEGMKETLVKLERNNRLLQQKATCYFVSDDDINSFPTYFLYESCLYRIIAITKIKKGLLLGFSKEEVHQIKAINLSNTKEEEDIYQKGVQIKEYLTNTIDISLLNIQKKLVRTIEERGIQTEISQQFLYKKNKLFKNVYIDEVYLYCQCGNSIKKIEYRNLPLWKEYCICLSFHKRENS